MQRLPILAVAAAAFTTGVVAGAIDSAGIGSAGNPTLVDTPNTHTPRLAVFERGDDREENNDDFDYDEDSVCYSYGIDYQDGGSYFIDSRSNSSFTCVSQFEHCVADTYSNIILVDHATGDQLLCSDVPTTPDLKSQMATCPITKEELTSGDWSIIAIGNNGDGSPFGWQRDFHLTVGVPQTTTITQTLTFSQTTTPTTTITVTSTDKVTTTVPNPTTVTVAAHTAIATVTPKPTTTTTTKTITRTSNRWTKVVSTLTKTVTPTCTVPRRANRPDPTCTIRPTVVPLPTGLSLSLSLSLRLRASPRARRAGSRLTGSALRARPEQAARAPGAAGGRERKRAPDAPVITETDPVPASTTTTFTAPTATATDLRLTTLTATVTAPPATLKSGTRLLTTTLPPRTRTLTRIAYTTTTCTRTMAKTWTYTTTHTPPASATACAKKGGHFGDVTS